MKNHVRNILSPNAFPYRDMGNISIRGRHHEQLGLICQDRSMSASVVVSLKHNQFDRVRIIGVADGIGSHKHSNVGASCLMEFIKSKAETIYAMLAFPTGGTTETVIAPGSITLGDDDVSMRYYFLNALRDAVTDYATQLGITKEEMGSTLSFAMMGFQYTFVFSIGDSPIGVKLKDGSVEVGMGDSKPGAKNATYSAFSSRGWDQHYFVRYSTSDVESVFAMTDGAEALLQDESAQWVKLVNRNKSLKERAEVLRDSPGQMDDVSFAYWINSDTICQ
jgi:hypothetical protein